MSGKRHFEFLRSLDFHNPCGWNIFRTAVSTHNVHFFAICSPLIWFDAFSFSVQFFFRISYTSRQEFSNTAHLTLFKRNRLIPLYCNFKIFTFTRLYKQDFPLEFCSFIVLKRQCPQYFPVNSRVI